MRVMVVLMVLVAIVATVFGLFPSVRSKAEAALFGPETAKKAAPKESEEEESVVAAAAAKAGEGLVKVLAAAKEAVTDVSPSEAAPRRPNATAAPAPSPPQPAQQTPQPGLSAAPAAQIELPPALSGARFGMTSSQVQAAYSPAWHRQQGGEAMFAHYPVPDKSQVFRFHFANESLYLIEVQFKQSEGRTLKELYDYYREGLVRTYRNAPEAGGTSWSDGTLDVHIRMDKAKNLVLISYTCPTAKG